MLIQKKNVTLCAIHAAIRPPLTIIRPPLTIKAMQNNSHYAHLIQQQAKTYGQRTALKYRDYRQGKWVPVSWNDFALRVGQVSRALIARGVAVQEHLAVFSQNKPECLYTDFGAYGIRAVTIPFYATSSVGQVAYMMNDAEIRFVFVGEQQQYDTMMAAAPLCHTLQGIVIFDPDVKRKGGDTLSVYFDEFLAQGTAEHQAEADVRRAAANYDDTANILYTSGTTGQSKGVILTHSMYRAAMEGHNKILTVDDTDVILNFLPFTHVFERGWSYLCITWGCTLCINLRPHDVQRSMQEVHPTCMSSVPRFWEKVYQAVLDKAEKGSIVERRLILGAIRTCGDFWENYEARQKPAPLWLRAKVAFYRKVVIPKLRKAIGIERSKCFPTAGAAVSPEVERFVHAAGIDICVGYGLTETTASVSFDHKDETVTMGSIGRVMPGIEVKIGPDNEILVKGPTVTPGYYRKPEETAKAIDADGWFHTGDAGYLKDGELYMTERIKDLFKTSNGKYIAPQLIEGKLTIDRYIEQAVVVADKRKFVSALVVPTYPLLEQYAREQGLSFASREELCQLKPVKDMIWQRIQVLQQDLAPYEQVKRFAILPKPFSLETEEITNTLKIKRRAVYDHYAGLIESFYA